MSAHFYVENLAGDEDLVATKYCVASDGARELVSQHPCGPSGGMGLDLPAGHVIEMTTQPTQPDGSLYRPEAHVGD